MNSSCSLSSSSGGLLNFFLQWSHFYNIQNHVERYKVTVTPDPSNCSSNQVSPSEDYSCLGLDLQTNYAINVSAINCGDQEGEIKSYMIQPQSLGTYHNKGCIILKLEDCFSVIATKLCKQLIILYKKGTDDRWTASYTYTKSPDYNTQLVTSSLLSPD